MRSLILSALLALLPLAPAAMAEPSTRWSMRVPEGTPKLEITSAITGQDYVVLVKIPNGPAPEGGWPSLWMMDGFATFPLLENARMADGSPVPGVIIGVGFPSGEDFDMQRRAEAYTPVPDADSGSTHEGRVYGGAQDYRRFLIEELRPAVAAQIPLNLDETTLFGFSYGGLFTMDTVVEAPDSFTRYFAVSPSLWFSDKLLPRRLEAIEAPRTKERGKAVWLFAGYDEEFPPEGISAARLEHLKRRAMISNAKTSLRALYRLGYDIRLLFPRGKDHRAMLKLAAPYALELAFDPKGTVASELRMHLATEDGADILDQITPR